MNVNNGIETKKEDSIHAYEDNNFYDLALYFELIFPLDNKDSRKIETIMNIFNIPYMRVNYKNYFKIIKENKYHTILQIKKIYQIFGR